MVTKAMLSFPLALALVLQLEVRAAPPECENSLGIEDPAALAHFCAGMQAWLEEDFAGAQRELEAAYAIEAKPELLYSRGQLARLQGDCEAAREHFGAYLETGPRQDQAQDARVNMERCQPAVPEPSIAPQPVVDDPIDPVAAPEPARDVSPRRPDALGIALTVVGSTMVAVGAGLFGGAFAERSRAEDELAVDMFERRVQRSRIEYFAGIGIGSAGIAVLVGGITRLVVARRRANRRAHAVR